MGIRVDQMTTKPHVSELIYDAPIPISAIAQPIPVSALSQPIPVSALSQPIPVSALSIPPGSVVVDTPETAGYALPTTGYLMHPTDGLEAKGRAENLTLIDGIEFSGTKELAFNGDETDYYEITVNAESPGSPICVIDCGVKARRRCKIVWSNGNSNPGWSIYLTPQISDDNVNWTDLTTVSVSDAKAYTQDEGYQSYRYLRLWGRRAAYTDHLRLRHIDTAAVTDKGGLISNVITAGTPHSLTVALWELPTFRLTMPACYVGGFEVKSSNTQSKRPGYEIKTLTGEVLATCGKEGDQIVEHLIPPRSMTGYLLTLTEWGSNEVSSLHHIKHYVPEIYYLAGRHGHG